MTPGETMRLEVRTPEGVTFSLPLASPVVRAIALTVDLLIVTALSKLLQQVMETLILLSTDLAESLALLGQVGLVVGLLMFLEWLWGGRTPGKWLLGLRVVDERGLQLRPGQIVLRNLFRLIDMLPGFFLVGGVAATLSRRCQRLGDLAAGTLVIRERRIAEPDLDALKMDAVNSLREHPQLEARLRQQVTPVEARLALDALMRRNELDPDERLNVFHRLAEHFRAAVEFPEEVVEGLSDEQYVRDVVETLYRKKGR